jgi:hypothetical protein
MDNTKELEAELDLDALQMLDGNESGAPAGVAECWLTCKGTEL